MKFALSVLAVLALVGSLNAYKIPSAGSGKLAKEFQDFLDMVPQDLVLAILRAYAAEDKEFQNLIQLIDSEETVLYVKELEAHPVAKKLMNYLQKAGLDIYLLVNKLNAAFKIQPITPFASQKITGGLLGLYKDLVAVIPIQQLEDLMESKIDQSPVYSAFIDEVMSRKYFDLYNLSYTSKHLEKIEQQAKEVGIEPGIIRLSYVQWIIARQLVKLHL